MMSVAVIWLCLTQCKAPLRSLALIAQKAQLSWRVLCIQRAGLQASIRILGSTSVRISVFVRSRIVTVTVALSTSSMPLLVRECRWCLSIWSASQSTDLQTLPAVYMYRCIYLTVFPLVSESALLSLLSHKLLCCMYSMKSLQLCVKCLLAPLRLSITMSINWIRVSITLSRIDIQRFV